MCIGQLHYKAQNYIFWVKFYLAMKDRDTGHIFGDLLEFDSKFYPKIPKSLLLTDDAGRV